MPGLHLAGGRVHEPTLTGRHFFAIFDLETAARSAAALYVRELWRNLSQKSHLYKNGLTKMFC